MAMDKFDFEAAYVKETGEPVPFSVALFFLELENLVRTRNKVALRAKARKSLAAKIETWDTRTWRGDSWRPACRFNREMWKDQQLAEKVWECRRDPENFGKAAALISAVGVRIATGFYFEQGGEPGGWGAKAAPLAWAMYRANLQCSKVVPPWADTNWWFERFVPASGEGTTPAKVAAYHFLRPSTEDPTKVAYYPNSKALLRGKRVCTTPGRYLTKYFAPLLGEAEIKREAELYVMRHKPIDVRFVESDDPDGWEWVYEHGHGFLSCMVYEREDRYIARGCCGQHHPVRTYALPGNGLRLAWFGLGEQGDEDGLVFGRCIVREDTQRYIRVFGDERLGPALEALGYTKGNLSGVRLAHRRHPVSNLLLVPYLDGGVMEFNVVEEDDETYLKVTSNGRHTSNSSGTVDNGGGRDEEDTSYCDRCGDATYEEDLVETYYGTYVCEHCLGHHYTSAVVEINYEHATTAYVNDDDVVYCESDGDYYFSGDGRNLENDYGIACCVHSGNYYKLEDLCETSSGYVNNADAIELDVPDEDGNDDACPGDACELADGRTVHKDMAVLDVVIHEFGLRDEMLRIGGAYAMSETVVDYPERFVVVGDTLFVSDHPERGGMTLAEWLAVSAWEERTTDTFVNLYDAYEEATWDDALDAAFDEIDNRRLLLADVTERREEEREEESYALAA